MNRLLLLFTLISSVSFGQVPNYVPTNGLVGWWGFNGNANDESGNGNNGTVNGATLTTDRFGNPNSAYDFDGVDDYIIIPDSPGFDFGPNDFSVLVWFLPEEVTGSGSSCVPDDNGFIVSMWQTGGSPGANEWILYSDYPGNNASFRIEENTTSYFVEGQSDFSNSLNMWSQLIGVVESDSMKIYVNGVLEAASFIGNPSVNSTGIDLLLGTINEGLGTPLCNVFSNLQIDDIGIWNRALTQCEISELYHAQTLSNPIVDLGDDTLSVCGTTTVLDATDNAISSYNWSTGESTSSITVNSSGEYTVEVTDTNGCMGYDTTLVSIIDPTITTTDTVICIGDSVTLSVPNSTQGLVCSPLPSNLQNGLVGYWPFCGNANDESGNGNDGVVNGATLTTDRFGNIDCAYEFDGINDYIIVNHQDELTLSNSDYSISCWILVSAPGVEFQQSILSKRLATNSEMGYILLAQDGGPQIGYAVCCGSDPQINSDTLIYLKWHNFSVTFDNSGNITKAYMDGNLVNTSSLLNSPIFNTENLSFGVENDFLSAVEYFFNGKIDDIGIWQRELSPSEIQQLYELGSYDITWSTGDTTSSITVQPSTTTTYSVNVSDGISSCVDDVTVTVNEVIPNLGQDTLSACGASTTLDAGTDLAWASYLWNTTEDTQTISVSNSGLYTVEVTDTNGCIGYDTTLVSIIDPTIDQIDTNICIGDSLVLSVCPTGTSCMPLPANLQNGLVAHYPFCGNANDESGNGNDGTVNGATLTTDRFCNENSAYYFDGVNDFIEVLDHSSLDLTTNMTLAAWFKNENSLQVDEGIIGKGESDVLTGYALFHEVAAGESGFSLQNFPAPASQAFIPSSSFTSSNWNFMVGTYDGSMMQLYINGLLVSQTNTTVVIEQSNFNLYIGKELLNFRYFNGYIDDITIHNRALTPSEIQELYEFGSYDITWSTGDTTSSVTVQPTTTTTYTVTVSDGISSCTDDVTITVNDPQVDAGVDVDVCNGDDITLTGSGADTYVWSGGVTDGVAFGPTVSEYYYVTGTDTLGCEDNDSVFVTVLQPTTSSITETVCDTYTAPDGSVYTTTGNYTAVIPNAQGCDSTITIDLTVNNSSSSSITETVCDSYTAPDGTVYTTTGNYTAVIPNAQGCDSTITIDLTVNNSSSSSITETVCDTYTAPDGTVYTTTGNYTAVIPNAEGCDSTITIDLTVNNSSSSSITETVCDTYTAPDGTVYTTTGNYTAVIPNTQGCDSTITIDLTITNSSSSSITETVCDTYTAPDGQTYTTTGNYTAIIPNAEGCDSTITIDLTVNALTTLNGGVDVTLCEGDSVILSGSGAQSYAWDNGVIDGAYFTPPVGTTTYTVTGTDVNGCEDTDDVQVTVSETPVLIITGFSPDCQGESTGSAQADVTGGISPYNFVWSNGSITSVIGGIPAGTYSVTVSDNVGCVTSGEVIVTDGTDPCFFIPGGLSPNGDGNNDTWGVTGLDNYPDSKVMVYNRWGQLLYDVGNDGPPWDGTYLGEELPTADYYYIIDLGNGETFNGVITLKR